MKAGTLFSFPPQIGKPQSARPGRARANRMPAGRDDTY
jgi:hypothetical protein